MHFNSALRAKTQFWFAKSGNVYYAVFDNFFYQLQSFFNFDTLHNAILDLELFPTFGLYIHDLCTIMLFRSEAKEKNTVKMGFY